MSEIGVAYVSIVPKFASGFKKSIEGELGGSVSNVETKGTAAFGKMFGGVGKLAAIAAGTITTAFGAARVFGGGMARLMGIEEAQAKMRGLGHDSASVDTIMKNALASVKGTSFGMADAATTAAGAVAAGIKPGADLERVLKSVSNSSAAAGTGMGEMGAIFNKVASMGKAQNDSLQQVADRGIPIYQALATQLGVSTEEVFKMASAGKIGFAEFEKAMTAASGTVAAEMGGTLSGSIANLNSSLGRIGANFLEGVFPLFAPALKSLTGMLGGVEDKAKTVGAAFGEWVTGTVMPAFSRVGAGVGSLLGTLGDGWEQLAGKINAALGGVALGGVAGLKSTLSQMWPGIFDGLRAALDTAVGWVADFVGGFVDGFGGLDAIGQAFLDILPLVTGPLGVLKSAVLEAFDPSMFDGLGDGLGGLGEKIGSALRPIMDAVGEFSGMLVGGLASAIADMIPAISGFAETVGPPLMDFFGSLASVVSDLVANFLPAFGAAWSTITGVIGDVVAALAPLIAGLVEQVMPAIQGIVETVGPKLSETFAKIGDLFTVLGPILSGLVSVLGDVLAPAFQRVGDVVNVVFTFIGEFIGATLDIINGWIQTFSAVLSGDWSAAWGGLTAIVQGTWDQIMAILSGALDLLLANFGLTWSEVAAGASAAWGAITAFLSGAWSGVVSTAQSIWAGLVGFLSGLWQSISSDVTSAWNSIVAFVQTIPEKFMAGLAGLSALAGKATEWVGGFATAAASKFGEAVEFARGIPDKIVSALGGVGSRLVSSGRSLIDGFVRGIRAGFDNAVSAVQAGMSRIRDFFPFSPAKKGPFSGKGYTTYSGQKLLADFGLGLAKGQSVAVKAAEKAMGSASAALASAAVPVVPAAQVPATQSRGGVLLDAGREPTSRIAPADIDRLASAIARMMRAQATQTVDAGMLAMSRGV